MSDSFSIAQIIQPHLKELVPYSSARDEFQGEASIYLDANENPFQDKYNRYPDSDQHQLRAAASSWLNISPDQLLFVNGSDEGIDLLIRAVARPSLDSIAITPPTYGMYRVSAAINNVSVIEVPLLEDFSPNVPGLRSVSSKIIFLCSPNNPLGSLVSKEKIVKIGKEYPGLLVVDEAYIDFSDGDSSITLLNELSNLVILRTFSKAWGLAGLRAGLLVASKEIISVLRKMKPPYNFNRAAEIAVLDKLRELPEVHRQIILIRSERTRLQKALEALASVKSVFPSEANFLLVSCSNSKGIYSWLLEAGIVVRQRARMLYCDNCLRVTVGTPNENNQLIERWSKFV